MPVFAAYWALWEIRIKTHPCHSLMQETESMFGASKMSLSVAREAPSKMVRPMSRKDIFYSGSVTNLREYQSQKSLTNYRNSVISLTKYEKDARDAAAQQQRQYETGRHADPEKGRAGQFSKLSIETSARWFDYVCFDRCCFLYLHRVRSVSVLRAARIVQIGARHNAGRQSAQGSCLYADRCVERVWHGWVVCAIRISGRFRHTKGKLMHISNEAASFKSTFLHSFVFFFTGDRSQFCLVPHLNHWHHQHIRTCPVRLCGWLPVGRFAAAEQHLLGDLDNCGRRNAVLHLVCGLRDGCDILWHCRV